jgi:hypothetical protein
MVDLFARRVEDKGSRSLMLDEGYVLCLRGEDGASLLVLASLCCFQAEAFWRRAMRKK